MLPEQLHHLQGLLQHNLANLSLGRRRAQVLAERWDQLLQELQKQTCFGLKTAYQRMCQFLLLSLKILFVGDSRQQFQDRC